MEKNPCGFLDVKYISDYHLFQIRQQILECAVCTVTFVQRYRFHQSVKIVMSDIILVLGVVAGSFPNTRKSSGASRTVAILARVYILILLYPCSSSYT